MRYDAGVYYHLLTNATPLTLSLGWLSAFIRMRLFYDEEPFAFASGKIVCKSIKKRHPRRVHPPTQCILPCALWPSEVPPSEQAAEESGNPSVKELVAAEAIVAVIAQATQPPWGSPYSR
jgi:hypothetical protein